MNKTAVCLVAKYGDIANWLAIAQHIAEVEQEPPLWIVHRLYVPILLGVSYVVPVPVTYGITRTDLALRLAHTKAERVINATCHGKKYKGPRDRAYNFCAWSENGFGEHFCDTVGWPLVFDKRDAERETALCRQFIKDERPVMILNLACAKSSPFNHAALFEDKIRRKWAKRFQIINLCEVNCARIYDVLGLFDRAHVMITSDTAALHLATASPKLKVICLTNDNPFLASEPRYTPLFRVNYAQALTSVEKVHEAIIVNCL